MPAPLAFGPPTAAGAAPQGVSTRHGANPCLAGTHVLVLAPDKSLVEGVVIEASGSHRLVRFQDGATRWLGVHLLACDVPARVVESDGAGFERAEGTARGAHEQRQVHEMFASIGASYTMTRVHGVIESLTGSVLVRWALPAPGPGEDYYLDVKTLTVARGALRCSLRRPDGRAVSSVVVPGRQARLMHVPTVPDAEGRALMRLDSSPEGAHSIEYDVWFAAGPAAVRAGGYGEHLAGVVVPARETGGGVHLGSGAARGGSRGRVAPCRLPGYPARHFVTVLQLAAETDYQLLREHCKTLRGVVLDRSAGSTHDAQALRPQPRLASTCSVNVIRFSTIRFRLRAGWPKALAWTSAR